MILKGIGMEKLELLYEGKTKNLYKTDSADIGILSFTDEITAMGEKKERPLLEKVLSIIRCLTAFFRFFQQRESQHIMWKNSMRQRLL